MEHLLSAWPEVVWQLQKARRILLLSDYDGTLTQIVERPELAYLPEGVRMLLKALRYQPRFRVGVISGRALSDLKSRVGVRGIIYAGNHGLEMEGPGVSFVNPLAEEMKPVLRVMHQVLKAALLRSRGVLVEDKGLTLSVHYREVPVDKADEVQDSFQRIVGGAQAAGQVRITSGKKVYEVRPAVDWDKGKAIRLLMKKYGKGGRESGLVPVYLGDDLTDEDGFRVIDKYGAGISVFVGEADRQSSARYFLRSPEEVSRFLERLLEYVQRG